MLRTILLLSFYLISTSQSQPLSLFKCDFEESCEDFIFDQYLTVHNISTHIDHTFKNLSGHYITYTNSSTSRPLTVFRANDWMNVSTTDAAWFSIWFYFGPGQVNYNLELAQGDDLQARLPLSGIGMNFEDPQWRGAAIELPYAFKRFIPFALFTKINGSLDLDDISIYLNNNRTKPLPPITTVFECDFDTTHCPDLVPLSNYSYSWYVVQAEKAQNYTSEAPDFDYSVGDKTGHYIWLNNSASLQPGAAGYLSTRVFPFAVLEGVYCLSFEYYKFGSTSQSGNLTVLALIDGPEKSVSQIWPINPVNYTYITGRWSWAYAPLPVGNYSILFRMDSEYRTDDSFAIDSISISFCEYYQKFFNPNSYLEFSCDFDNPASQTCGIQNDNTDLSPQSVLNFTIQSPGTINDRELGPRQGSGWSGDLFYYWSRSTQSSNMINGQFKTPPIETNRDMCIRFAYFVNSTNVQSKENNTKLDVMTRNCRKDNLWSIELDQSFGWQLVVLSLSDIACRQEIYFHISQKRAARTTVAFDDITIAQCGTLDVLTTVEPTSTTPSSTTSTNSINTFLLINILLFLLHTN